MKNNKGFATLYIIFIIIALLALGSVYYSRQRSNTVPENKPATPAISNPIPAPYISAQDNWPPVIKDSAVAYSCTQGSYKPIERWETIVNGTRYCVKIESEGAAGSIYRTYTYTTAVGGGTKTTNFTLRYVQCPNYSEPEQTECLKAQADFNLDTIVDSLMQ